MSRQTRSAIIAGAPAGGGTAKRAGKHGRHRLIAGRRAAASAEAPDIAVPLYAYGW